MIKMRNGSATLLLGLVLACGSVTAQQAPGLIAKNPIRLTNVEGRMDHLGIDLKGQRLFVTAFDNHTLEVLDLKTGRQMHTIPGLNQPQGAYYNPATNRLFVACGGDGTVKIFDGPRIGFSRRSPSTWTPTMSATTTEAGISLWAMGARNFWPAK